MSRIEVKDIKVKEINFAFDLKDINKPEHKKLKSSIQYLDNPGDAKTLLPLTSKFMVDFKIYKSMSSFANLIRRCILDELPINSMECSKISIDTDDKFVLSDYLQKNIELIPINQDINYEEGKWTISLDAINMGDSLREVTSGEFVIMKDKKQVETKTIMSINIPIIELHPTKSIKLKNIEISKGFARNDASKYASVSNMRYGILNLIPKTDDGKGTSTLVSSPTDFTIGYTTYRNTSDGKSLVYKCCDVLHERVSNIKTELSLIKDTDTSHFCNLLDMETKGAYTIFQFKNEFWSLANTISQYCLKLDPLIPFVSSSIVHYSVETGVVKIKHKNPKKIISDALGEIILDIEVLRKAF